MRTPLLLTLLLLLASISIVAALTILNHDENKGTGNRFAVEKEIDSLRSKPEKANQPIGQEVADPKKGAKDLAAQEVVEEKPEKFIEEELLLAGEDPGAVYYMSRIREVANGQNWEFAKELFRKMKEKHPNSMLLEEARLLLEKVKTNQ
jgi:hypothetical protein